jgi:hypothetical protein
VVVMMSGATCTVSVVLPETLPCVALMVVLPAATAVARPAALMIATPLLEEAQLTWLVMFCALPSEYVPVAKNCCVAPGAIVGFAGVTAIDDKVAVGPELNTTSTQ